MESQKVDSETWACESLENRSISAYNAFNFLRDDIKVYDSFATYDLLLKVHLPK